MGDNNMSTHGSPQIHCNRPSCKHDGSIAKLNANLEIMQRGQTSQEKKIDRIDQAIGDTEHDISTSLNNFGQSLIRLEILSENQGKQINNIAEEQGKLNDKVDKLSETINMHGKDIDTLNEKSNNKDRRKNDEEESAVKIIKDIKKSILIWIGGFGIGITVLVQLNNIISFVSKLGGQ